MGRLAPSVAAGRVAVRQALAGVPRHGLVLIACSGGPDSLALAWTAAFVAPRLGLRAGLVTIDHGLQDGSAQRAADLVSWAQTVGLQPALAVPVRVHDRPGGPEAAARTARYAGLVAAARDHQGSAVLLGHTLEDQAETVLLALARGAGPRGIAAMPAGREIDGVPFLRPLLGLSRALVTQICAEAGLTPWVDPHNSDPGFTRSRLRAALPALAELLGPDLIPNLARTAGLVGTDLAALDRLADAQAGEVTDPDGALRVPALAALDPALRGRLLRRYALRLGVPGGALSHVHLDALEALVSDWHGQGQAALPGGVRVARVGGRLIGGRPDCEQERSRRTGAVGDFPVR